MQRAGAKFRGDQESAAETELGTFSDAGLVQRMSGSCTPDKHAVWVETRGINVTATKPGTQVLRFFGDPVTLTVR